MAKVDVYNLKGEKETQMNLPGEIFESKINPQLLAQSVRVFKSNQRMARAKAKTRGDVTGSGIKIWRQKGTGRARHGDRYAPIFVGGGVAHGPTGLENYQLKMSQKMKKKALFSALTAKFEKGQVVALAGLEKVAPKTKDVASLFKKLIGDESRGLLILPKNLENIRRATRNLANLDSAPAALLNTYQVLNGGRLIFLTESLGVLETTFLGKKQPVEKKSKRESKRITKVSGESSIKPRTKSQGEK